MEPLQTMPSTVHQDYEYTQKHTTLEMLWSYPTTKSKKIRKGVKE